VPEKAAPQTFHITAEESGKTLAAVLRARMDGTSWSAVQRLVRSRYIMIDGNLCRDEARRLKRGEVVKVMEHPLPPPPKEEDVVIRFLDSQVVVVEKPSGLTSVRHHEERQWKEDRKNAQPTLEDLLPRVIAKIERSTRDSKAAAGRGPQKKPGQKTAGRTPPVRPVHRLDRDTSGLMIFARTVPAERHLGIQFRKHTTHRRYLAVVEGHIAKERTIESQLVRDRGDGRRGSTEEEDVGKTSITHIKPIERVGDYTLVECRLETGRTHQIRIHLAEAGHPLCGEKVYRRNVHGEEIEDRSGAPRVALHAAELGFQHPTTCEDLKFSMPLPRDLQQFLERLRGHDQPKPTRRERKAAKQQQAEAEPTDDE
jgi:23S rRNA pseudouridine1911/1915/1917 synthase